MVERDEHNRALNAVIKGIIRTVAPIQQKWVSAPWRSNCSILARPGPSGMALIVASIRSLRRFFIPNQFKSGDGGV